MLRKKEDRDWSHSLFERSHLFKKYWFIEAFVILIIWIIVIILASKSQDGWVNGLSWLSMHIWIWRNPNSDSNTIGTWISFFLHLIFVVVAIAINIYKRFRVCNSLSCYLGESDGEKFKNETKALNMATAISSFGMVLGAPVIYFLSFLFRIVFLKFIRREEKESKERGF